MMKSSLAGPTVAARGVWADGDAVARLQTGNVSADIGDNAGYLMPANDPMTDCSRRSPCV